MDDQTTILDQAYISESISIDSISDHESILRMHAVRARTGLSETGILNRIALGTFPPSICLGTRAIGFLNSDVSLWIKKRMLISNSPELTRAETDHRTAFLAQKKLESEQACERAG